MIAKLKAFEYFVYKLTLWYNEAFETDVFKDNDLSKLKIFKLHFFTTAISTSPGDNGLLRVFDDFHALPFGPVESDIYGHLGDLEYFSITSSMLTLKKGINIEDIAHTEYKQDIDNAIELLQKSQFDLIKKTAFDLVEISHQWSCWSIVFEYAKTQDKLSSRIPKELILLESQKVFSSHPTGYVFR